ncbi:Uncharacterized conserved protein, DUF1015 family [Butyrivibrio sp. ob235]|uniref:DUF1015 domain-containing protein n=1 Tax=Butyrivibrio sp. ob235 TaxID=1761780 RepID=UPI0008D0ECAC|nr:DUF1015 domain-containing protein [Butyrivibrio sp. ob235]SEK37661.1 Uncharacterized conserved protein, DUF1015 family [Butyrivibrio sp. ob235]
MADIRAFAAYRPREDIADRVAALPYDVYNREEARAEVVREPMSFLAIDRPETQFPEDYDMYSEEVYRKAHDMLWGKIEDGTFVHESKPCYYLYEQTMNGRVQTGIVACSSVRDYDNNIIKKHENTLAKKEADRIHHVDTCDAQTGPIFLCYRENEAIRGVINRVKTEDKPVYDFVTVDGIKSRVFIVDKENEIDTIKSAFEGMDSIYIADGHHRCASAVKVAKKRREADPNPTGNKEYDFFLSVLFPDSELMIMDYNRVIKDLNGMSENEFLSKISEKFDVKEEAEAVKPSRKYEVGMLLGGKWYRLYAHDEIKSSDAVDGLDVSVLQNQVLTPLLDISDPKNDPRIDFVGGIRGLSELEKRCKNDCVLAFSMYPTDIHELFAVADAGRLMPPKSTWFEPKLLSGLFIHAI